jgi:glucose/arabinose dehydrogenase/mono/diheme cytochrome c family protein
MGGILAPLLMTALAGRAAPTGMTAGPPAQTPAALSQSAGCPAGNAGLTLPEGFCATVFADGIGHARHLAVTDDGIVYVNTWSGAYYENSRPSPGGFLVALQDTNGTGRADVVKRFGETVASGGAGGTGIGLYQGRLFAEINDQIVRYDLTPGTLVPTGKAVTVVSGLPLGGDHPMHPFIIDAQGAMYVDVASASNSCQPKNRQVKVPGEDPCKELLTRGGVWRYDANKTGQKFSSAGRYATGIRNAEGFAIDGSGQRVFVTQHGRDQLHSNWPELYKPEEEATLPAEEVLLLQQDGDFGWPYCYFDPRQDKLVLAPEYGGDGGKAVGRCAQKIPPVAVFPAHWGPNGMTYYDRPQFPQRYRRGLFLAFHGSWNRAPFPQGGYNVIFKPFEDGAATGRCEIFADGFAGPDKAPDKALHRPSGIAVAPDGALFVSDDSTGRIYRITFRGDVNANRDASYVACPSAAAAAGGIAAAVQSESKGVIAPGATAAMVSLGDRIYHGQVGGASCTGCHGANGGGSPLGPSLTDQEWLWSDGSVGGIRRSIVTGVAKPKHFRAPMPAKGGATLTDDQVSALAAYVWGLSHPR